MTIAGRGPVVLAVSGAIVAVSTAAVVPAVANAEGLLTLPVARAAMAEYEVVCDAATSCPTYPGQNDALTFVCAELDTLAQPNVPDGAVTGEPNAFIWGYKAGEMGGPPAAAIAAVAAASNLEAAPPTVTGQRRQ